MSPAALIRIAARSQPQRSLVRSSCAIRRTARPVKALASPSQSILACHHFSTSSQRLSGAHGEETFEEFSARFTKEFEGVQDVFELQRNLNNAFAYDLVPSPEVIKAALEAARRVNDFPTAVRVFEGIRAKVENKGQYEEYLVELKDLRESLGINLKEDLYPDEK